MSALQDWLLTAVAQSEEVDFAASQSRGLIASQPQNPN